MFKNFLLVGLGGGLGSMLRYAVNLAIPLRSFPVSTLLINITGSLIIGAVIALSLKSGSFPYSWRLFLATGICGGFTTFSAFSFENFELLQQGKYSYAFIYIILSIVLGIGGAWLGYKLINN